MISPYLKRPLRALDEILSEAAAEGQPGSASVALPERGDNDDRPAADAPARRPGERLLAGR